MLKIGIQVNKIYWWQLSTYIKLKQNWGYENYLSVVKNFDHRKSLSKLRIFVASCKLK